MAKKKSASKKGLSKWLYIAFPVAITLMFVLMALTCYDVTIAFVHVRTSLFDYLLDEHSLLTAGVFTLVINILASLYFIAILIVSDKARGKLKALTAFILCAVAVSNLVLAIYTCVKLGWDNITFAGVASYILWYAIAIYALCLLGVACYKACKK